MYAQQALMNSELDFYAPSTIDERHYVFLSVYPFVRLSVRLFRSSLKFLIKVVFNEVEVQSTWNLVYMLLIYGFSNFNAKLEFWCQFHGPLAMENDSASEASVYFRHILVFI